MAEVDVGLQGVQGHPPITIPFTTRHLCPAKTARDCDLDAFGTRSHGAQHPLLDGAAESDAPLQLAGHVLSHERGVQLWMLDLLDGHSHALARKLFQVVA